MKTISIKNYLNKNPWSILIALIILYILIFFGICLWKYINFQYDALDLAIYNQVFFNSSIGNYFDFSIHPHSYLGDHLEFLIIFLVPFYALIKHPLTLLFLQTFFLALCAWPLGLIAKTIFKKNWVIPIVALWFLISPFIQNINTFEFHILPFAIFTILWAFYFFIKNNLLGFIISIVFSLMVREDVALVIICFGFLAIIDKKKNKFIWTIIPILFGAAWLYLSMKITAMYSGYDGYKFLIYYQWLGDTPVELIKNIFLEPLIWIPHFFSMKNINFFFILFISFCFLPLFKLRYLIPSVLIWLQYFFSTSGNEIIYKTHYSSLLLPCLFVASIFGLKNIIKSKKKIYKILTNNLPIVIIVISIITIYSFITVGPVIPFIKTYLFNNNYQENRIKNNLISKIPDNSIVMASYDILPNLSSRKKIYSLHYTYIGHKQFIDEKYETPNDIEYVLIDFQDFIEYELNFNPETNKNGDNNIKAYLENNNFKINSLVNKYAVLTRDKETKNTKWFYEIYSELPAIQESRYKIINNQIEFLGFEKNINNQHVDAKLYFKKINNIKENLLIEFELKKDGNIRHFLILPLGYGIYPTSEWEKEKIISINYSLDIPKEYDLNKYEIYFNITKIDSGVVAIQDVNSVTIANLKTKKLEPSIKLH